MTKLILNFFAVVFLISCQSFEKSDEEIAQTEFSQEDETFDEILKKRGQYTPSKPCIYKETHNDPESCGYTGWVTQKKKLVVVVCLGTEDQKRPKDIRGMCAKKTCTDEKGTNCELKGKLAVIQSMFPYEK